MTKKELLEFLRNNLRVELNSSDGSCYGGAHIEINVYLDKDLISTSSCTLPEERPDSY